MSSDDLDFRRIRFETPEIVDRNWLDWFREEFSRHFSRVDMTPAPDVTFSLQGTSRMLPDLCFYNGISSPNRSQSVEELSGHDDPALVIPISGDMSMHFKNKDVDMKPGTATLVRGDVPATFDVRSRSHFLTIRLNRSRIEPLVRGFSDLTGEHIPTDTQAMRLLLGYIRMLNREDQIESAEARHLAAAHVHELAALVLGATRDAAANANGNGVRAARFAAVKADILANLNGKSLSVANVAARHGVTARYVQMLFEAEGITFSEYVVEQRLARAYRMLTDPRLMGQPVSAVAFGCGFGDLSYFNRTFRRRYGMTPTDVRVAASRTEDLR